VRVQSANWKAESRSPLPRGARVRVLRRDGLKLIVEPAETPAGQED
jgi:membrane protein implicated in regulation of membrane protease activity